MLKDLFHRNHFRYSSLPLLGSTLDGFSKSLLSQGYKIQTVRGRIRAASKIDHRLRRHGCRDLGKITRERLRACGPRPGRCHDDVAASTTVRLLERYFDLLKILPPIDPPTLIEKRLLEFGDFLHKVRGLAPSTTAGHLATASRFLSRFKKRGGLSYLSKLTPQDIEDFIHDTGKQVDRGRLQHIVAHLRSFLRFLGTRGEAPLGLDTQIDTPRIYREEKLPRSLPWETVRELLQSIDRSTQIGKRDYAMLVLIATYGLRTSEVSGLKIEDVQWRKNQLQIFQRKTATPLVLPLADEVGTSILDYLKNGRPAVPNREIFVTHKAPLGILQRTGVTDAFQACVRRSGLPIPFQGPHCLRHSYAVHLLRQGTSIKTIGDVLGHRSFESTCIYLRLAVEDLRTVPLSLPVASTYAGVVR